MKKRPEKLVERSRQLRQDATWPEKLVWSQLRAGRLGGFKFRRQHPILGHIADFACVQAKVVVEIDGDSHDEYRQDADKRKDEVLAQYGWKVVRLTNTNIANNLDGSLSYVYDICRERIGAVETDEPPPQPSP